MAAISDLSPYETRLKEHGINPNSFPTARGSFARIVRSTTHPGIIGKLFSPRKIEDPEIREAVAASAEKEIGALARLRSLPHVTRQQYHCSEGRDRFASIQLDAGPRNLWDIITAGSQYDQIPMRRIERISRQLLEALAAIHCSGRTAHLDVKPANICIDKADQLKLVDFGLAATEEVDSKTTAVASRPYRAPEVLLDLKAGQPEDIWAAGCILFEMATKAVKLFAPVYDEGNPQQEDADSLCVIRDRLDDDESDFLGWQIEQSRPHLFQKMSEVRKVDPYRAVIRRRLGSGEKTNQFLDLLEKMLQPDPDRRVTAEELLTFPFFTDDALRTDTHFRINGESQSLGLRILDDMQNPLLSIQDLSTCDCYHVSRLNFPYRLEFFDPSNPAKILYAYTTQIQDGQTLDLSEIIERINSQRSAPKLAEEHKF